ncbi:hypothetical protein [Lacipirellula limnantheis]|uniref:Antitoxin ParD4 n=1 Tax=Lacipirellula limnantheis TaxID=2528024 RepID=A0A517TRQ6_9BACT|nr:hypothetical protein [Lacipirellula limnantheis]QDT71055.1 hypothetical protein I41_02100 [Lacipirellula limnantheis]
MLDSYPPEIQAFVQQKIAAGVVRSADEFAIEAAALYCEVDRRREELKAKVAAGMAQLETGDYVDIDGEEELREFFEDVKRRGRERLAAGSRFE